MRRHPKHETATNVHFIDSATTFKPNFSSKNFFSFIRFLMLIANSRRSKLANLLLLPLAHSPNSDSSAREARQNWHKHGCRFVGVCELMSISSIYRKIDSISSINRVFQFSDSTFSIILMFIVNIETKEHSWLNFCQEFWPHARAACENFANEGERIFDDKIAIDANK